MKVRADFKRRGHKKRKTLVIVVLVDSASFSSRLQRSPLPLHKKTTSYQIASPRGTNF